MSGFPGDILSEVDLQKIRLSQILRERSFGDLASSDIFQPFALSLSLSLEIESVGWTGGRKREREIEGSGRGVKWLTSESKNLHPPSRGACVGFHVPCWFRLEYLSRYMYTPSAICIYTQTRLHTYTFIPHSRAINIYQVISLFMCLSNARSGAIPKFFWGHTMAPNKQADWPTCRAARKKGSSSASVSVSVCLCACPCKKSVRLLFLYSSSSSSRSTCVPALDGQTDRLRRDQLRRDRLRPPTSLIAIPSRSPQSRMEPRSLRSSSSSSLSYYSPTSHDPLLTQDLVRVVLLIHRAESLVVMIWKEKNKSCTTYET